jgi:glycosyltransferase involved in cell wall biosynthesis
MFKRSETMTNSLELLSQLSEANTYQPYLKKQPIAQEWLAETAEIVKDVPLRVLIVLSQQPSETGSGIFLREVVDELQKMGHRPYLLAAHYRPLSSVDFPSLSNDQIYTMIFDNKKNTDIAEISFAIPGMSLDMPYLHVTFRSLSEAMLNEYCRAWIAKLQTIVEKIRPHIIHVNHLWLLPGIARVAVPWMPIVATSHGTDYKLLLDAPTFARLILPGVQYLDVVMPISSDTAYASVTAFGVRSDRVHVIGNGYNEHLFRILPRGDGDHVLWKLLARFQDLPPWNKLVLYVGKFADYKGVPYLIRAAKLYSEMSQDNVLTLIVGEGSKQARVT